MEDQYAEKNNILLKEVKDAEDEKIFWAHWTEKSSERNFQVKSLTEWEKIFVYHSYTYVKIVIT